jgi:hypothetical protein
VVFLTLLVNIWIDTGALALDKHAITFLIVASAIYVTAYGFYLIPTHKYRDALIWLNAFLSGIGLG